MKILFPKWHIVWQEGQGHNVGCLNLLALWTGVISGVRLIRHRLRHHTHQRVHLAKIKLEPP